MSRNENHLSLVALRGLLAIEALELPDEPRIEEIRVSEYTDSTDEEALDIRIVFPDDVPDDKLDWEHIEPIERTIRSALRQKGETRWPYFTIGRKSEYSETNGEADAAA